HQRSEPVPERPTVRAGGSLRRPRTLCAPGTAGVCSRPSRGRGRECPPKVRRVEDGPAPTPASRDAHLKVVLVGTGGGIATLADARTRNGPAVVVKTGG